MKTNIVLYMARLYAARMSPEDALTRALQGRTEAAREHGIKALNSKPGSVSYRAYTKLVLTALEEMQEVSENFALHAATLRAS